MKSELSDKGIIQNQNERWHYTNGFKLAQDVLTLYLHNLQNIFFNTIILCNITTMMMFSQLHDSLKIYHVHINTWSKSSSTLMKSYQLSSSNYTFRMGYFTSYFLSVYHGQRRWCTTKMWSLWYCLVKLYCNEIHWKIW